MSRIRGQDTKPEEILRRALWRAGLRYRRKAVGLPVRPDAVFLGSRVAVFVDGCFWHGCPDHYVRPRSRTEFWSGKLKENVDRDVRQTRALEGSGWKVVRFWEHEVFTELNECVELVRRAVRDGEPDVRPTWRVRMVEPLDQTGDAERRHLIRLRAPGDERCVEQARHTRKWRRPGS